MFGLGLQFRSRSVSPLGAGRSPCHSLIRQKAHTQRLQGMERDAECEASVACRERGRSLVDGEEFERRQLRSGFV